MLTFGGGAAAADAAKAVARRAVARKVRIIKGSPSLAPAFGDAGAGVKGAGGNPGDAPGLEAAMRTKGQAMTDKPHTEAEVAETFWKAIEHHKTGMLGLT